MRRSLAAILMASIVAACGTHAPSNATAAAIYAGAAVNASHGCGATGHCSTYESCVNGTCCVPCGAQCCGDSDLCVEDYYGSMRCATRCTSGVQECTAPNTCCEAIDGDGHCSATGTRFACIPEGAMCIGPGGLRSTKVRSAADSGYTASMSGGLQHVEDDSGARCVHCGAQAAGPCASCHLPVCGDCSTLTEGGVQVWAICLECDRKKGRHLLGPWGGLLLWVVAILAGLALVVWLLEHFVG